MPTLESESLYIPLFVVIFDASRCLVGSGSSYFGEQALTFGNTFSQPPGKKSISARKINTSDLGLPIINFPYIHEE